MGALFMSILFSESGARISKGQVYCLCLLSGYFRGFWWVAGMCILLERERGGNCIV